MPALKHYNTVVNYMIIHVLLGDAHGIIQALYDNRKKSCYLDLPSLLWHFL